MDIIKINEDISYIKASENPILSADIGIISGQSSIWLYDVGANSDSLLFINKIEELYPDINIVASHFHEDHMDNIRLISANFRLYAGKYTCNHYKSLYEPNSGHIEDIYVDNDIWINDKNDIHIFPIPSSHAKGCVGMEINEEYAFIGDAYYCKHMNGHITYNQQLLRDEIKVLSNIKANKLLLSHDNNFIQDKSVIINKLEKILSFATKDNPYIYLS